jgi:hypothetical protein
VTSALSDLGRRGIVRAVDEGFLLAGEPPGEIEASGADSRPASPGDPKA